LDLSYLESNVAPRIAIKWFDIGLYLDIPDDDLYRIKQITDPCGSKCTEMLSRWLARSPNDPDESFRPTWRNMYNAMLAIECTQGAEDLKEDLMNLNDDI